MNYQDKYLKYKSKYTSLKSAINQKEMVGGMVGGNEKTLYLFKADWCGHCNNFKPVWNELIKNKQENIKFITYDADTHKEEIKAFQVQGFPTLILKKGDEAIEYSGGRDIHSLKEFISTY
jgi:thiol-disulfide isomerase/thioredoxin